MFLSTIQESFIFYCLMLTSVNEIGDGQKESYKLLTFLLLKIGLGTYKVSYLIKKESKVISKFIILMLLALISFQSFADSKVDNSKISVETADWHKDEECRMVFFTVLEGLYRDGVPDEVVDLVIGHVKANSVKKRFVFRCKLCHACYEAFAVYQRRPAFSGTKGKTTIGNKPVSSEVIEGLKNPSHRVFGKAFSTIIQPWIKQKLLSMNLSEKDKVEKMKKFAELAKEGNRLLTEYRRCQACEAIKSVSEIMEKK